MPKAFFSFSLISRNFARVYLALGQYSHVCIFFLYFSIMGKFIEQFVAFCSLDIVFFFGASYYVCVGILLLIIDIGDFLLISFLSLSSFLFVKISSFSPCISVKLLFVAFIWSCVPPSIVFTYRMVLKIYNSF